ncbi:CocE/NonD family hydrolase [Gemmatimonas sp.]|jgi:putative CocE/NonD family hydrolase|nr:CocE/NonD family hydrolase [Gemmatimonas sp.]MCA2985478.1 CocE/NonD family hydrolase [Gemmatimonas sp.]
MLRLAPLEPCLRIAAGVTAVLAQLLSWAPPAAAQSAPVPLPPAPATHEVTIDHEVLIPMRDGTRLGATIVRPRAPGRYPVVVRYEPYGRTVMTYFAERGYVTVLAEGRGTGSSGGIMADYFDAISFRDGYDVVEWAAAQPWSTGKVGLWGISYGAINATRIAALRPPHLAAVAVNSSYANFFGDHFFPGGVRSNHPYVWHGGGNMLSTMLRGPVYPGADGQPVLDLERWRQRIRDNKWEGYYTPQWTHDQYDAYWEEKDLRSKYATYEVPTLQVGNYFDHARNHDEAYLTYQVLKAKGIPQQLIVGPWTHGGGGPAHTIDFPRTALVWFDQFLRGIDTGITREPPVTLFVMRQNMWRTEDTWPIARTVPTTFQLGGDGTLATAPPRDTSSRRFVYRPWVGSAAGPYGTWFNAQYDEYLVLPDQRADEGESLTFTTDPLSADVESTGMPEISFLATSTATNTDFSIKLSDVFPDGRSALVTRGWINSAHRESNVNPRTPGEWRVAPTSAITPGVAARYRVTLQNVSYRFRKGHRLRVTIASSDWPSNWPNPLPATNTVHVAQGGTIGVSTFTLPVVPASPTPRPAPRLALRTSDAPRAPSPNGPRIQIVHDLSTSTVSYQSDRRSERAVPGGTMEQVEVWRVDVTKAPPYRQVIDYANTQTLRRPGFPDLRVTWRVRTDSAGPKATVEWFERPIP